ncbi:uncharacterized protein BYT42DRAFT_66516 [Radiomyces spectabilis]|uniref:uncharacterized protein n=1 Tax=Radiomyces spectabilis TaxID=64574 RepID=UPI00221E3943|nr:uncharacterized protein BYT42DRAFT_66516 [Radiomyces spectabilis]KAI8371395.1 hypothetical protein BYT42DRAFT_66516 [Radiomyces spectabilis]
MRRFVTEIMPRTNDLLHDIQQLQAFLDLRVKMYDKNLAENGQAWKALGMMVDDQLIATAKEWIYRIALTLLEDIYTEHGKQRVSPVQDEQMMDCLLHGLEFVGSAMQFIGVSSVEITYRCQILADVYLQWISKALETLNNTSRKEIDSPCLPKLSINSKSMRPDLRLMHLMEHTSRLLTALQWVRDIRETHFDSPACVPQITATLVEICIRALSVVETIKNAGGHGSNYAASKRTNIMADPQVIIMHMEGSILAFAEKVILLSKEQTTFHHPSVQVIFLG